MAKLFVSCKGKTACREDEHQCHTCGRSLGEIYTTRTLIDGLVNFAQSMGYENSDAFFDYVAAKAKKKLTYQQQQADSMNRKANEYH